MVFNYRRFTVSYMEWQEWKQLLKLHAMLSPLKPTNIVKENIQPFVNAGSKDANGNYRKKKGTKHTAIERSKTFEGIARAMAEQWAGKNV